MVRHCRERLLAALFCCFCLHEGMVRKNEKYVFFPNNSNLSDKKKDLRLAKLWFCLPIEQNDKILKIFDLLLRRNETSVGLEKPYLRKLALTREADWGPARNRDPPHPAGALGKGGRQVESLFWGDGSIFATQTDWNPVESCNPGPRPPAFC